MLVVPPLTDEWVAGLRALAWEDGRSGAARAMPYDSSTNVNPPLRTFQALQAPDQALSLQQRLDRLTMPVLGLWCHDDRITDISGTRAFANCTC